MSSNPSIWQPAVSRSEGPLYLAIADALQADIRSGELPPGRRLPPQRSLAEALGVDFTTISRAYAEAARRGLVEGRVGQGTFIRAQPVPQAVRPDAESGMLDMSMNTPPMPADAALARLVAETPLPDLRFLMRYQTPGGTREDRAAGAAWLAPRLGAVPLDRLLVAPGAQGALLAVLGTLAQAGDTICAEALTYPGLIAAAAHLRLRLVGLPMDAEGILPDAFEQACRERAPRALYCNPTLQNPTTITLPAGRRLALVEIARRHGVPILEDDAYGALPEAGPPPIAAFGPDVTWHVAGLAKPVSPVLRVAYLVVPEGAPLQRVVGAIRATAAMASPLGAGIATRWIHDGTAAAITAGIRREARARQRLAARLLPADALRADPEGFHLWLSLPAPWTRGAFVARLRAAGVGVVASDAFTLAEAPEALRIGLGAPADSGTLEQALGIIAGLWRDLPTDTLIV
ncbi:PLP-dependent aminotransferase family protein [Rhodovarius crocodyli]|uniref:PLP-dependent aminotransferase family protein n=1 Tax=Rhodovarius crocodyli TaxID=1979269 RepID=A0A437MJG3_9PROT|nr:PLP-dependent aminotransferase family protein [Rhodovarius crocodyli]RVT97790.1 PLP-dependent aminotransferase family protein [Rhodovarius crocodyli]